ncbi:MAG: MerR family DNA-binding transcriptional regulator [Actinobacteria bacterium]|nr:MerR family DNA-binding transcriptional regulator [Actinomycetota bacterium]
MAVQPTEHVSIGEVLAALRDEFSDITISKIRFLESQGLIDPERTPSGYRKFYPADVARLRWILFQQKEHFLPLKVIKTRLDEAPPGELPHDPDEEPSPPARKTERSRKPARDPKPERDAPAERRTPAATGSTKARSRKASVEAPKLPLDDEAEDDLAASVSGASFTRGELATAAGVTDAQLAEMEGYGLLHPAAGSGNRVLFDEESLTIAKLAAAFAAHGIDARHLRMYRHFAEREAGLFGQVIQPVMRQRNPEARTRARDDLVELARLGRAMRAAFLRETASELLAD